LIIVLYPDVHFLMLRVYGLLPAVGPKKTAERDKLGLMSYFEPQMVVALPIFNQFSHQFSDDADTKSYPFILYNKDRPTRPINKS